MKLSYSCRNVIVFGLGAAVSLGRYSSASRFVLKPDFDRVMRRFFPSGPGSYPSVLMAIQRLLGSWYTLPVPFPRFFGFCRSSCLAPQARQNREPSGISALHFRHFIDSPLSFCYNERADGPSKPLPFSLARCANTGRGIFYSWFILLWISKDCRYCSASGISTNSTVLSKLFFTTSLISSRDTLKNSLLLFTIFTFLLSNAW